MDFVTSIPSKTVVVNTQYIQLTLAQRGLMARFGIRAASKHGTIVIARKCKCGTWQDYECDLTDTYRNRWEIQHAFEKLSGDDWRCATCRIPHTVKDVVSAGGSGNGGSGRTHRNRAGRCGDARVTRKQIEARIKQLAAMIANPGRNTPEAQIEAWQAEQDALALTLATWTRRKAVRA